VIAFTKPRRIVSNVFVHCSASDKPEDDDVAVITAWHLARGFSTIGYHFFIHKDGEVEAGRNIELAPAAQQGHNTGSIAICVHGLEDFTDESLESLRKLCEVINIAYDKRLTFHGHCEVNPNKTCPVYDYKKVLNLDSAGRMLT